MKGLVNAAYGQPENIIPSPKLSGDESIKRTKVEWIVKGIPKWVYPSTKIMGGTSVSCPELHV